MILEIKPTAKQYEAYQYLLDQTTAFVVYGGAAGGGKSFLGCEWIFGSAISYPGTAWFIGRESLNDLRVYTIQTIFEVFAKRNLKPVDYFRFNAQDNIFIFHNGSTIKFLELRIKPGDPNFDSLGSTQFTGGWIEEAAQVKFAAFDTLKARIGRWKNDEYSLSKKMLLTCNPAKNWLYNEFYKPWKERRLPFNMKFIQALVTDNNYAQSGFVDSLDQITDKIRKQRLRFGNWEYDNDDTCLMDGDAIRDLFTNDFVERGKGYITADIARFGKDKTVIMVWDGWACIKISVLLLSSVTNTATVIKEMATALRIPISQIVVDEDGVGGGVKDILKCKGFVNNSSPIPQKGDKQNYDNLKSQCSYTLADKVNGALLFILTEDAKVREMITEELEQIKKKNPDGDGKLSLVPKEIIKSLLGRSPDYSDALIMRMYFELQPKSSIRSYA